MSELDVTRIMPGDSTNFETMKQALADNNGGLMRVYDKIDKRYKTAICAIVLEGDEYVFTPFATMIEDNPYERFIPATDSNFLTIEQ